MGVSSVEGSSGKNESNGKTKKVEKSGTYDPVKTKELVDAIEKNGIITGLRLKKLAEEQDNPKKPRNIPLSLEALEKSGLESDNFRVDSSKWEMGLDLLSGVEYLINPEGDIIELTQKEFKNTQLFSQEAAIRETQKYGKKIPTLEQWQKISAPYGQDGEKLSKQLGLRGLGYWDPLKKKYYNDDSGYYWTLNSNGSLGQSMNFNRNSIFINQINNTKNFLPVRCIRN